MNTAQPTQVCEQSFRYFLLSNYWNRIILYSAAIAIVLQFSIFKYLYPYANYIHGDSFSYLGAADNNLTINTYLIGYSKFLRLLSVFAKPDIVLVAFQYLFIQCSVLFLLLTIFYFYNIGRVTKSIMLGFMIFNPLFLHLGNLVSSDALFLAFSMNWFALLLWVINKPTTKVIVWQSVFLFLAFTFRYNALIYPFISIIAFYISRISFKKKIMGLGLGFVLCVWFIGLTMYQYKKLTGYWQYSPFSGWQMANNAMYAYRYVDSIKRKPVPIKFKAMDNMIRKFYDETRYNAMYNSEEQQASTFYMWSPSLPLVKYRDSLFKSKDSKASEFKRWASMGPLYTQYGLHLIKTYPTFYARYFLWPNSRKYFAPPVEFLEKYNTGYSTVTPIGKKWFGYKTFTVKTRMENPKTWILNFYPILSGIINLVMLFGLLYYLMLKGWQDNKTFKNIFLMGVVVWISNAVFTICASSAALRFQSFPVILTTTFAILIVDWMLQLLKTTQQTENRKLENQLTKKIIA